MGTCILVLTAVVALVVLQRIPSRAALAQSTLPIAVGAIALGYGVYANETLSVISDRQVYAWIGVGLSSFLLTSSPP